jgi:hypothetical protein
VKRRVVVADVKSSVVALSPAGNGAMCVDDVRQLATAAALSPKSSARTVWITRRQLADFEAYCSMSDVVVQRRSR